jgi:ubiquitin carboxyl-terminal hydrolase L3
MERGRYLETCSALRDIHTTTAQMGQTEAPSADADVDLHFISFVKVDGQLYEMDGSKSRPINHGPCTELLSDAAKVIQKFIDRDPELLQFTVMALSRD